MNQPAQQQEPPGRTGEMTPRPDHGEESYQGCGRLTGKAAVITGADSGIGRAVAIAFAREGADVLIAYLDEHEDAQDTARYVEQAGRKCVLVPGDLSDRAHAKTIIPKAVEELGGVDVLVNNAAQQMTYEKVEDISDEEWDRTLAVNLSAFFYLTKAALPHMRAGGSIIGTSSVNSDSPTPTLLHAMSALLPGPDEQPGRIRAGKDLRPALNRKVFTAVTALGRSAARRLNELPGGHPARRR